MLVLVMVLLTSCSMIREKHLAEIKLSIYNRSSKPIDSIYIDLVGRSKYSNPIKVNKDTTFVFDLKDYIVNDRETTCGAIVFQENYHCLLGFGFQWMSEMDTTRHYHYYVFDNGINTKNEAPLHSTEKTYSSH